VSFLRSAATLAIATLTGVAAVALALAAIGEARDVRRRLNLEAPLVSAPGQVAPAPPRAARRVVVLLVDGLRLDSARTMASLEPLRAAGVDAAAVAHYPTLSRPNYVAIFAGLPPRLSGARTNDYPGPVPLDTVWSRVREAGLTNRYVTDFRSGAGRMFLPHLDDAASVHYWPGMFERVALGALADERALVVIHFAAVDLAGHADGADSEAYRAAVAATDATIARVVAELDLERDAVVVVSDHGHVDAGGHGGQEDEVTAVPLILAGAGVAAGVRLADARLVDLAPTLCALLGLPAPRHAIGRTLVEALRLEPPVAAALARVDAGRAGELEAAAAVAMSRLQARAWLNRLGRAAVVIGFGAILVVATLRLGRRGLIRLDRRVLVVAIPAFPLLFYGLLAAFEPFLSPSMTPEEDDLVDLLLRYGAIAAALNVLCIWLAVAWRIEPRERLAAATGVVLIGLLVAALPAGLAWIVVSPPFAASVPGPLMMVLPSVTLAGVACYALSAVVALVAEWAVFAARASA
jgi:hypothetical protein